MAEYNQWMNQKLYEACAKLPAAVIAENRGAFFGSILGTLNHLLVGDTVWLKRFASTGISALEVMNRVPHPESLDSILFDKFEELKTRREEIDQVILNFAVQVTETELQSTISYKSFKGVESKKVLFSLLMHFFNHQTHHRGQVTTLLSQLDIDFGVTDLLILIPNFE
jgi:uncharacterized damage-inducible protein DinB